MSDVGQSVTTDVGVYSNEDSTVDLGSRSHGVSLRHDVDVCLCEPHHLTGQLKVCKDMIMASMKHLDDTHTLVDDFCWRATMAQDNLGDISLADFISLKEAMVVTRSNYLHLLAYRDYLLAVSGVYQGALGNLVYTDYSVTLLYIIGDKSNLITYPQFRTLYTFLKPNECICVCVYNAGNLLS